MIEYSCRDCKYYFEDEDRRKCMHSGRKGLAYYGGCPLWTDEMGRKEEKEK